MSGKRSYYENLTKGNGELVAVNDVTRVVGPGVLYIASEHHASVRFPPGSTGGVIVLEESDHQNFPGTSQTVATFTWAAANAVQTWKGTGKFEFLRFRVTTAVDGDGSGAKIAMSGR